MKVPLEIYETLNLKIPDVIQRHRRQQRIVREVLLDDLQMLDFPQITTSKYQPITRNMLT